MASASIIHAHVWLVPLFVLITRTIRFIAGVTDNYFILVEQPLAVSIGGMLAAKVANRPMASCFRWYQHEKVDLSSDVVS